MPESANDNNTQCVVGIYWETIERAIAEAFYGCVNFQSPHFIDVWQLQVFAKAI